MEGWEGERERERVWEKQWAHKEICTKQNEQSVKHNDYRSTHCQVSVTLFCRCTVIMNYITIDKKS